jgi:hypothetical protein
MNTVRSVVTVLVALLAAIATTPGSAEDSCCRCGGGCQVRKMCRVVCEPEVIKDYCYGCECEEFCIPGCAKRGCKHCDGCCGEREEGDCCGQRPCCCLEWFDWCPTCATPKCVKKLVKYEISREVPRYKWVVETVCESCCHDCGCYHPCDAEGHPAPEADMRAPGAAIDPAPDAAPVLGPASEPMPPVPVPAPAARAPKSVNRLHVVFQP